MSARRKKPRPGARLIGRARDLRRDSTGPEQRLWSLLRNRRLGGLKFKRQHAVGRYVVDFYCADANLAVELDGESHVGRAAQDEHRTAELAALGVTVVRYTNDDVLMHIDAVAEAIARAAGLEW